MAVLFRSKYPCELVWIPKKNRCIQFVSGEYETSDEDEIAALSLEYEGIGGETIVVEAPPSAPVEAPKPKRGRPSNGGN